MKARRQEDPRNYVLVEEPSPDVKGHSSHGHGGRKSKSRPLADEENVCDVWKTNPAMLVLMERDKVYEVKLLFLRPQCHVDILSWR